MDDQRIQTHKLIGKKGLYDFQNIDIPSIGGPVSEEIRQGVTTGYAKQNNTFYTTYSMEKPVDIVEKGLKGSTGGHGTRKYLS